MLHAVILVFYSKPLVMRSITTNMIVIILMDAYCFILFNMIILYVMWLLLGTPEVYFLPLTYMTTTLM